MFLCKTQLYLHFLLHIGVAVIQIGLPALELMKVPLLPDLVERPGRATEYAQPVVRWIFVVVPPVRPHVVIGVLADAMHALIEPVMLIGCVIGHEIENNLEVARARARTLVKYERGIRGYYYRAVETRGR